MLGPNMGYAIENEMAGRAVEELPPRARRHRHAAGYAAPNSGKFIDPKLASMVSFSRIGCPYASPEKSATPIMCWVALWLVVVVPCRRICRASDSISALLGENMSKKSMRVGFWLPLLAAGAAALALWGAWGQWGIQWAANHVATAVPETEKANYMAALGQTGDLFGGINALFAALAFAGVGLAAFYQYESWQLQKEQTRLTQEQARLAREEHIQQSFEPLFFKLLERFESVNADALDVFNNAWEYVVEEAYDGFRSSGAENDPPGSEPHRAVVAAFQDIYERDHSTFGPYYRSLFQIFKFISNSNLTAEQKTQYANITRTTLSEVEVTMLGFNCLNDVGRDFLPYVEAYGLLKHVKDGNAREIFKAYYKDTASMSSRRRIAYWREHRSQLPDFLTEIHSANA